MSTYIHWAMYTQFKVKKSPLMKSIRTMKFACCPKVVLISKNPFLKVSFSQYTYYCNIDTGAVAQFWQVRQVPDQTYGIHYVLLLLLLVVVVVVVVLYLFVWYVRHTRTTADIVQSKVRMKTFAPAYSCVLCHT